MCSGKLIQGYSSLWTAKKECKKDAKCNGIVNIGCKYEMFWTCNGKIKQNSMANMKSCAS